MTNIIWFIFLTVCSLTATCISADWNIDLFPFLRSFQPRYTVGLYQTELEPDPVYFKRQSSQTCIKLYNYPRDVYILVDGNGQVRGTQDERDPLSKLNHCYFLLCLECLCVKSVYSLRYKIQITYFKRITGFIRGPKWIM